MEAVSVLISGKWYRKVLYAPPFHDLDAITKPARVKGNRWGYCGIAAMSAAIGVPPLDIYAAIPDWPGYTPSKMVRSTLNHFGYACVRQLVPAVLQRDWPQCAAAAPSWIALGRIYWGEGKFAGSHWLCFNFCPADPDDETPLHFPLVYDNGWREERFFETRDLAFYQTGKLKTLYWIVRDDGNPRKLR